MVGLIFRKIGMVTTFNDKGVSMAATLLYCDGNTVLQKKAKEKEGYNAVVLGFGEAKEKNKSKSFVGMCKKANTGVKKICREVRDFFVQDELGHVIKISDVFNVGDKVVASGVSKGKGFQGVVKRHGFSGVGGRTHGQHNRQRHGGSLGASSFPGRVFPGLLMSGRMGNSKVTIKGLRILSIDLENNLVLVNGAVPGSNGSFVVLKK